MFEVCSPCCRTVSVDLTERNTRSRNGGRDAPRDHWGVGPTILAEFVFQSPKNKLQNTFAECFCTCVPFWSTGRSNSAESRAIRLSGNLNNH
eukprot:2641183-Rhodomonas_salina.2